MSAGSVTSRPTPASEQTDLYAVGVTLYQLLTRKYPYGEIEPFQTPKFGDPVPPTRYRPDIPAWLESVLLKAVARDPKARFETAEEFLLALERGAHRPLVVPRKSPLLTRDPQLGLKLLAAISLAPQAGSPRFSLAQLYEKQGDQDKALAQYRLANERLATIDDAQARQKISLRLGGDWSAMKEWVL